MQFHKHSIVMKALVSIQTEKTLYHSYWWLVSGNYLGGGGREEFNIIQSKTEEYTWEKTRLDRKWGESALLLNVMLYIVWERLEGLHCALMIQQLIHVCDHWSSQEDLAVLNSRESGMRMLPHASGRINSQQGILFIGQGSPGVPPVSGDLLLSVSGPFQHVTGDNSVQTMHVWERAAIPTVVSLVSQL